MSSRFFQSRRSPSDLLGSAAVQFGSVLLYISWALVMKFPLMYIAAGTTLCSVIVTLVRWWNARTAERFRLR